MINAVSDNTFQVNSGSMPRTNECLDDEYNTKYHVERTRPFFSSFTFDIHRETRGLDINSTSCELHISLVLIWISRHCHKKWFEEHMLDEFCGAFSYSWVRKINSWCYYWYRLQCRRSISYTDLWLHPLRASRVFLENKSALIEVLFLLTS